MKRQISYVHTKFEAPLERTSRFLNTALIALVVVGAVAYQSHKMGEQLADATECYGMSCEQYQIIAGQAYKEARQAAKSKKVASVWSAVNE